MVRLIVVLAFMGFMFAGCAPKPDVKPVVHTQEQIDKAKEKSAAQTSAKAGSLRGGNVSRGRNGASRSGRGGR